MMASATMKGVKAASKNGSPTENRAPVRHLGHQGPDRADEHSKVATASSTLLARSAHFPADHAEQALRLHRAGPPGIKHQRAAREKRQDRQNEDACARGRWQRNARW